MIGRVHRFRSGRCGERAIKLLYIAGYGRSGSTVLGALLGSEPGLLYLGEVAFLAEDWKVEERLCSCGSPYADCEFWNGALTDSDAEELARASRSMERFFSFPRFVLGFHDRRALKIYRSGQRRLLAHALGQCDASLVVDGSKSAWATTWRALALEKFVGCEVFVLHLVRDGRSTLQSIARLRSNWEAEGKRPPVRWPMLRATVGWTVANLTAAVIGRSLGKPRYLRLGYEELLEDPTDVLRRIGNFVGEDLSQAERRARNGDPVEIGHVVSGSRIRFEGPMTLRRDRLEASDPAGIHRFGFTILGGWLNRLYGYG